MTILQQLIEAGGGKHVDLFRNDDGEYCVMFEGAYISEELTDSANKQLYTFGRGETIEEAIKDYIEQISGKTIGFDKSNEKWHVMAFVLTETVSPRASFASHDGF